MKISPKGFSTIETTTVFILILLVLIGFGGYIKRALLGRWHSVGETMGQGKQYDPRVFGTAGETGGTLDCFFDQMTNKWVDEKCYRANNCDCTLFRADGVPLPEYQSRCVDCKILNKTLGGCQDDRCQ